MTLTLTKIEHLFEVYDNHYLWQFKTGKKGIWQNFLTVWIKVCVRVRVSVSIRVSVSC